MTTSYNAMEQMLHNAMMKLEGEIRLGGCYCRIGHCYNLKELLHVLMMAEKIGGKNLLVRANLDLAKAMVSAYQEIIERKPIVSNSN